MEGEKLRWEMSTRGMWVTSGQQWCNTAMLMYATWVPSTAARNSVLLAPWLSPSTRDPSSKTSVHATFNSWVVSVGHAWSLLTSKNAYFAGAIVQNFVWSNIGGSDKQKRIFPDVLLGDLPRCCWRLTLWCRFHWGYCWSCYSGSLVQSRGHCYMQSLSHRIKKNYLTNTKSQLKIERSEH